MQEELKQTRASLNQAYTTHQRELIRQQRRYKKIISAKCVNRKESIEQASSLKTIEHLKAEKADVKAQIWVANGATHTRQNEIYLKDIKCQVACQEKLTAENKLLKARIQSLELQLQRVDETIYELNRKTIPEKQHQAHVLKVRRTKEILENQLDVSVKRECKFTASNQCLREEIVRMVNFRALFNDLYTKMMQRLKSDNKYLIDLVEYAQMTFENGTTVYEKIAAIKKKEAHDQEVRKVEMQGITRKIAQDNEDFDFLMTKDKKRELADLEPREYKRRNIFIEAHKKKIKLFDSVLDKVLAHSGAQTIDKVIENFQEQESLYYSYFNYANEKNYHITMLNTKLNELYRHIENLRVSNKNTLDRQVETIFNLEQKLESMQQTNRELADRRKNCDDTLNGFFKEILGIFVLCRADQTPLKNLLGDHSQINIMNVKEFLLILEERINQIVARVFILQRKEKKVKPSMYTVRNVQKICELPTELDDIVLVQQCPECAEGDAINSDVAGCAVQTLQEVREKLQEKVIQPEMQYRLHSLTECRLQRSRLLANSKLN